jgi:hypothetical protein
LSETLHDMGHDISHMFSHHHDKADPSALLSFLHFLGFLGSLAIIDVIALAMGLK